MQRSSSSFDERVIGAIRLDPATYEDVEHDTDATWQAAVVVAAAILTGVGSSAGRALNLLAGVLTNVVFWALLALFAYLVGVHILKGPQTSATFGEELRARGFSCAPSILAVLGLIPGVGYLIVFIAGLWSLIGSVIALRQSLEVSPGRVVASAVVVFLTMVVLLAVVATVFGISIVAVDSLTQRPT
jgi:Yip1 domain